MEGWRWPSRTCPRGSARCLSRHALRQAKTAYILLSEPSSRRSPWMMRTRDCRLNISVVRFSSSALSSCAWTAKACSRLEKGRQSASTAVSRASRGCCASQKRPTDPVPALQDKRESGGSLEERWVQHPQHKTIPALNTSSCKSSTTHAGTATSSLGLKS